MESGWNLVGHLLLGRQETFNFDLYDSSNKKIGKPPTKLVNFVPESIVPTIVECFFGILEGRYYMFD